MIRTLLILSILLATSIQTLHAQNPIFIGIQPAVTIEPFYERGEFDLNIVPIVIEEPISERINLRLITLANFHFGESNGLSDIGTQIVAPRS